MVPACSLFSPLSSLFSSAPLPTLHAQPLDTRSVTALCGVGAVVLVVVSSAYL